VSHLNFCKCGCGEKVAKEGNKFVQYHNTRGKNNSMFGKSWCKGLTKETHPSLKRKSESMIGKKNYRFGKEGWNKGKTKDTNSILKRISESLMGEKNHRFGKPSTMKGKHHTIKTKKKLSKLNRGKNNHNFGKHPSAKTRQKMSATRIGKKMGKNNHMWLGGISFEPYTPKFNVVLQRQIMERDNFTCKNPNCDRVHTRLCIHHIDYCKENCKESNLITLCVSCNGKANRDRSFWKAYFSQLMQERLNTNITITVKATT